MGSFLDIPLFVFPKRELERFGIIKRRIVSEYPIMVEYSLTDVGKGFEPVLLSAASFQ